MIVHFEAGRAPPTPNTVVPWVPPAVLATVSKSQKYMPDNSDSASGSEIKTGNESSSESDVEYDDFHRVPPHAKIPRKKKSTIMLTSVRKKETSVARSVPLQSKTCFSKNLPLNPIAL